MFDESEIRKTISVLKPEGQLFEARVICDSRAMYSGYFKDANTLVRELKKFSQAQNCNTYITLNQLDSACYDRMQKDRFVKNPKSTTSDNDVAGLEWLMIDLDPKRPAGTSSTDAQLKAAKAIGNKIFYFMRELGFNDPVSGFSGNGVHLLYRVRLKNSDENKKFLEMSLKTLNMLFSTNEVDVDMKNFNPSRVCKLYGTLAQKGSNTAERPHRMSRIVGNLENAKPNDVGYIKKLCKLYPEPEKPRKYNNYSPEQFDLENWMNKYGLGYRKTGYADGTKYILDCCPFDNSHKGKDACIFQSRNGAIGFHCFHNSCSGKRWQDVRMLYEPDAYEKRRKEYEQEIYLLKKEPQKKIETKEGKPVFYNALDILNLPVKEETFLRSGIDVIDKKMRGLKKTYITIMSGLRASGKSSIISEICLDCVEAGGNVGVFSGELSPKNFMRWLNLQAAGKGNTEPTQFEGYFNVKRKYQEDIAKWLGNRFWLYNNEYGNNFQAVIGQFEKKIEDDNLDLLILDNLMSFDIKGLSDNKYDAQTEFVLSLKALAERKNAHIMFVAHPRKAMGFLRLDDIAGTADLGNAVDNAFIVHRVNNDFVRLTKQMFGWRDDNSLYNATNVIEIAKDRDGGIQDCFVPLYYEPESKRLKNDRAENKIYSWKKEDAPTSPGDGKDKSKQRGEKILQDGFSAVPNGELIPFD